MNDDKVLLDAAYIKLRNNEPMSEMDFKRIMNLIANSSWGIGEVDKALVAGLQSQLIALLQQRFMKGQQPTA